MAHAGVERPAAVEPAVAPIPGDERDPAIDAAAGHQARSLAVEVGDAGQEPVAAVAIRIVAGVAADPPPAVERIAAGHVVGRRQRPAGRAVEHGEILGAVENPPVAVRPGLERPPVAVGVADRLAGAVAAAVGRLAGHLGTAVSVEIVGHELRVVLPLADVPPEVDPPQQAAVELVGVEHRLAGDACRAVVARPRDLVEDDLEVAVTVEVGHRRVAGPVAVDRLDRNLEVALSPGHRLAARRPLHAVAHRADVVGEAGRIRRGVIDHAGRPGERSDVDLQRRAAVHSAVDVEGDVVRVGAEEPPADEHAPFGPWQGHDPARQVFHLPIRTSRGRHQAYGAHDPREEHPPHATDPE